MDINHIKTMRNKEIFGEVKKRINLAIEKEDYQLLDLADLGFQKENIKDGRLIHELHSLEDDNEKIEVDFRCYDPSGPFQNLKDINKFTADYFIEGKSVEKYQRTYED
tara:strand:+ start:547 stop:870 length:324 start_codon:yes stop_codon:yes gene_type:complete